jgi:predicted ABC-type transport system involved in lysophospholipase L1 biosynthesis ATPase subunit
VSSLEIDHLNKSYGSLRALRDLTFDVKAGEIFGFVGSNGAGKTTAMRIMLGVLAADSGQVRWNGTPLDLEARRRVGYMPEERGLYPKMKVGEQLRFLAGLHGMSDADADAAVTRWTDRLGVGARRRTERPQWRLDVDADRSAVVSAVSAVPGVSVTPAAGRTQAVVVELAGAAHAAEQAVLAAAMGLGPVREFSPVRPTLTDLFRDVVSAGETAGEPDGGPAPTDGRRRRDRRKVAA